MTIIEGSGLSGITEKQETTDFVSKTIFNDGTSTIIRAKVAFTPSQIPAGSLTFLTADGGSHWEEATWNEWHTFTTQGTDLRFKIRSATGTILAIENAYDRSSFLKVEYALGG